MEELNQKFVTLTRPNAKLMLVLYQMKNSGAITE